MNTFNDFIDVTRGLVNRGFSARERVAALGRSAGGVLIGGIANMAPGDYRVILAIGPIVDRFTTMLEASIPLVMREYDEWGNPNKRPDYEYMLTWSAYDNVGQHSYPAMYVYTGLWAIYAQATLTLENEGTPERLHPLFAAQPMCRAAGSWSAERK
jgi:oligopeptidase B